MADPILMFDNFFERAGATFTATNEAAGFPKENALDWRIGTPYRWKSTGVGDPVHLTVDLGSGNSEKADCYGFAGHNFTAALANCAPVAQWSDNGTTWVNAFDPVVPPSDLFPRMFVMTPLAHRHWRVEFEQPADDIQVGVVVIGRRLDLPGAMLDLDPYGEEAKTTWTHSEGGELLGTNYRWLIKRFMLNYQDGNAPNRDTFFNPTAPAISWDADFLPHARSRPFLFSWNLTVDANLTYLARVRRGIRMPFRSTTLHRNLRLELESFAGQR